MGSGALRKCALTRCPTGRLSQHENRVNVANRYAFGAERKGY